MTDIADIQSLAVPSQTVTNVERITVYGDNATIGTSFETVTNLNADIVQIGEAAGDNVDVTSGDAADDGDPVGTGAQTVLIKGLDVNFNPQQEIITLNGTGAVASASKYVFINEMIITAVGTGLTNAGVLTLADVAGSDKLGEIDISGVRLANCIYMVPAGHSGYIGGFWYDVDSVAAGVGDVDFALQIIETGFQGAIASEVWKTVAKVRVVENDNDIVAATGGNANNLGYFAFPGGPIRLGPKTIVRVAAKSPAAVAVQAGFSIDIQGSGAGTTTTVN